MLRVSSLFKATKQHSGVYGRLFRTLKIVRKIIPNTEDCPEDCRRHWKIVRKIVPDTEDCLDDCSRHWRKLSGKLFQTLEYCQEGCSRHWRRLFQTMAKIVRNSLLDTGKDCSRRWRRLFRTQEDFPEDCSRLLKIVPDTGRLSGILFQTLVKIVPDTGEDSLWTFNKPQRPPNKLSQTLQTFSKPQPQNESINQPISQATDQPTNQLVN